MEGLRGDRREKRKGKARRRRRKHLWKAEEKVGVSAAPFYDGLVESAVFSPFVLDCRDRAPGSNLLSFGHLGQMFVVEL